MRCGVGTTTVMLNVLLLCAGALAAAAAGEPAAEVVESTAVEKPPEAPQPLASGRSFGDQHEWYSFDDGLRVAEAHGKPAVIVIHKSWCGACRSLGPRFAASEEITALAKDFVMINVQDDEEPRDASWHPDGSYIPRIFFYDGVRRPQPLLSRGAVSVASFATRACVRARARARAHTRKHAHRQVHVP
jgi:thiol-disulfide isomerase/thioredoxin